MVRPVNEDTPSLATRLWFAWACFFRVLSDPSFAARAWTVREAWPALPTAREPAEALPPPVVAAPAPAVAQQDEGSALQLLALLQREGRLVDFLQQDIAGFDDAEVGAAVRVVHEGCSKALRQHAEVTPIRGEDEGARIELPADYDADRVKLTGNVRGSGPFEGVLRHRGWRVEHLSLPVPMDGHDARVLAPAEVEL